MFSGEFLSFRCVPEKGKMSGDWNANASWAKNQWAFKGEFLNFINWKITSSMLNLI
ncbi:hypothetical protein Hanom_Chr03g00261151 [Helianthus anomalus]